MKQSKHNKKPQKHLTKEELIANLQANAEFKTKMRFVREQFYPALIEATESIEDASMLLAGFNTTLMQEFLGYMKEKKMSELKLENKLDKNVGTYEKNKKLLDLFQDMDVFSAKEYIEGLREEIELFKQDYFKGKPLSELPTKWIDEL